ncbi:hypothetical protein OAF27_01185 [Verrucomicrobiales bacterium]|nr:hypothetical protein [Verrucomicrobiales bacterium]
MIAPLIFLGASHDSEPESPQAKAKKAKASKDYKLATEAITITSDWKNQAGQAIFDLTITNGNSFAVQNISTNFHFRSPTNQPMGSESHTFQVEIPALSDTKITGFNAGKVDQQASTVNISILGFAPVIPDSENEEVAE